MMKKAVIIHPDSRTEVVDFAGYETIKDAVGGWIEAAFSNPGLTIWCAEEGKIRGLPMNAAATRLWWLLSPAMIGHDVLVGSVLVTGGTDSEGETLGLSDEQCDNVVHRTQPE